jgi:hypothetical protein
VRRLLKTTADALPGAVAQHLINMRIADECWCVDRQMPSGIQIRAPRRPKALT